MLMKAALLASLFNGVMAATAQQRVAKVHGVYTYELNFDSDITLREAKRKCIALAKADAIKKEFGELITSDVIDSNVETNGEATSSFFWENTEAKAKGTWIGDLREPQFDIDYSDGKLTIQTEVWGEAREIKQSDIDLKWKILRDGGGQRIQTDVFGDHENVYVSFKSPADGYLAIYVIEGTNQTTCLLPYPKNPTGRFMIKGGREYLFFEKTTDDIYSTRYTLSTNGKDYEKNEFVVIYSPNPFTKFDVEMKKDGLQVMSTQVFQKKLLEYQRKDEDMVVNKKWVTIRKDNN